MGRDSRDPRRDGPLGREDRSASGSKDAREARSAARSDSARRGTQHKAGSNRVRSSRERAVSKGRSSRAASERTARSTRNVPVAPSDDARDQTREEARKRANERIAKRNASQSGARTQRSADARVSRSAPTRPPRAERIQTTRRGKAEQLVAESGIPADVLKDPTRPASTNASRGSHANSFASRFARICSFVWSKSKLASIAIIVVVAIALVSGVDGLANMNRIYQGVSVGGIDLSGKTPAEASALIAQEYEPRINDNDVVFCANEEAAKRVEDDSGKRASLEEQISYEESLASRDRWTVDAQHLGAIFDPAAYAEMAYQIGRSDGGLIERAKAQFAGVTIEPVCTFNATSLDEFRDEIIAALGTKMVNFNVEMEGNHAKVTDGHAGYEVSLEWLTGKLNEGLLQAQGESRFVIDMHDVPIQIDHDAAQACANKIDASIAAGITFQYEGKDWYADRAQVAQWIATRVDQEGAGYRLTPLVDDAKANQTIIKGFGFTFGGTGYNVQFADRDGSIEVTTNASGTVPQVRGAIDSLNNTLFTDAERTSAPVVAVSAVEIPETMSFDEACDYGLVGKISSFTTQYASGAGARNNNIHVAADALDDSICKAGETWSFLALAGEATPEKGYQDAGAIIGGEYSDAVGGGICQVATTVFNAVYDAGYPIERRYNHSLYIASYPEGRDAAIAYPDMDLVWRNNTESDVLLVMTYTNSSVTATLYGVDPGYEVTTTYGEWQEGEPYKTVIRKDPDYPADTEFVESSGADGRSITIVQTVKDKNGNIIQEKEFHSNYNPKNKVVVQGSAEPSTSE